MKFAIIGSGAIAYRHAQVIFLKGQLVATCDVVLSRALDLASKYKASYYVSAAEMLDNHPEIDIVSVCSPNNLHAFHTISALTAGHHVICEKPMALSISDCNLMMNVANNFKRQLFIVKQNRFNPAVVALQNIIKEGLLGKIFSVHVNCFWNRRNEYYQDNWKGKLKDAGGTLFTQFSHFIDLLCWLFDEPHIIYSKKKNLNHQFVSELEDEGVVLLEWNDGKIGSINYTLNAFEKNMEGSIVVFGEKGTIKVGGQYLNLLEYQAIAGQTIVDLPVGNLANDYGSYQGSMSNHELVYDNVLDVLSGRGVAATSGIDGRKTVSLIEKIYNS